MIINTPIDFNKRSFDLVLLHEKFREEVVKEMKPIYYVNDNSLFPKVVPLIEF